MTEETLTYCAYAKMNYILCSV